MANFIGQWAATLLIFGIQNKLGTYNKLVKQHGSDHAEATSH